MALAEPRGMLLAGRYFIEGLLGVGGCGAVYRAVHTGLNTQVAVKFLLRAALSSPIHRERFRREALALGQLRHPGIVTVHDVGEEDGTPYIVMELLDGNPLSRLIGCGRPTPAPERLCAIFDQVLEVLQVAHDSGIVHRDMKPDNVMLVRGPRGEPDAVKVLDFGLALSSADLTARLTAEHEINGTPLYMSPEQSGVQAVGPPSDVYSVGVMLYEALAGDTPFQSEDAMSLLVRHMYVRPPTVAQRAPLRPSYPELEALALWAMSKRPGDRPTAAQLRGALAEVDAGRAPISPLRAAPPGTSQGVTEAPVPASAAPAVLPAGARPLVELVGVTAARAEELGVALAVHGFDVLRPSAAPGEGGLQAQAVILSSQPDTLELLRGVRADQALGALPVLVVDVPSADDTAGLIRAGASDAALALSPDDLICRKLWRLLRRRR